MENQEKVWDKIANKWKDFRINPVDEVKEFLKNKKGKVLDLGCGSGRNFIIEKDLEFYGIDFSKKMVKIAKQKPYKKVLKSNAWEIEFPDNFFDYALYISALHCIPLKENREKSLAELARVLKPKARALISVWDKEQPKFKDKKKEIYRSSSNLLQKYSTYSPPLSSILASHSFAAPLFPPTPSPRAASETSCGKVRTGRYH